MANYAILVAISWYPGLTELHGPENDVGDFRDWLCRTDGGNLLPENVKVIKSSDFPKVVDPYEAQPAEAAFRRVLKHLLFEPDGVTFKNEVGERLYLFFAGHGFAGKQLAEAALYTAQASRNDPDHIACKRYAERIVKSKAFDEVVLVMDCCRDVDLSDSINNPNMKLPDRQGLAAEVRFMEAYGAGRGQQARERAVIPDGVVRGLFTYAFVDALRNSKGDQHGNVTGAQIKGYILDLWPTLFNGSPSYYPEIAPPSGEQDIVFIHRPAPKIEVHINFNEPLPTAGSMIVIQEGSNRSEIARVQYEQSGTCIFISNGIYKVILDGTSRSALIDVSGSSVEVTI